MTVNPAVQCSLPTISQIGGATQGSTSSGGWRKICPIPALNGPPSGQPRKFGLG
jgi:hypothetical protein